jgi:ketosteroid isomerase-like protein
MTQAIDIARNYLNAFYANDRAATRALLAEDFDFGGPFSATIGADAFLDSARRLLEAAEGTNIVRSWQDGGELCVVHEVAVSGQRVTMADWLTVSGDRVTRERVYFDAQQLATALAV